MNKIDISWKTCFRVGVCGLLLYLGITYWQYIDEIIKVALSAAAPILIGCAIAYLVNLLMSRYEMWFFPKSEKKAVKLLRRPLCMTGAFITLGIIVIAVIVLVVPQLIDGITLLVKEIPGYINSFIDWLDENEILSDEYLAQLEAIDWKSRIDQIIDMVTSGLGNVVNVVVSTVTALFDIVVTIIISLIFSVYLLLSKEKVNNQIHSLFRLVVKGKWYDKTLHILSVADESFKGYIVGQCTEAVILGGLCTLGMLIFGFPYAPMIGALMAFTALIPVAGAYIGALTGAFMILTVSPIKALLFLVFILILQQFEGNVIFPKVVGNNIGLPGIWVLAAVVVGGGVMGVLGMLIGVPLAATVYKLLREVKSEKLKNLENIE